MLYITQLIYIKEGKEETFHQFEDIAIPARLLALDAPISCRCLHGVRIMLANAPASPARPQHPLVRWRRSFR